FSDGVWTALVPFWAVWPFEVMLLPARHARRLSDLTDVERDSLARTLQALTARYDALFGCEFPFSMVIAQAPFVEPVDGWRLHVAFLPPLLRSATVRKFHVGYELLCEAQRDLTPELAAERLREVSIPPTPDV